MLDEEYECSSCNAVFSVDHDMDGRYYRVSHCPFCGEEIEQEQYDFDPDQESE
jgi:DNA-directed RNA polymerase subunit RPC12/RpoP